LQLAAYVHRVSLPLPRLGRNTREKLNALICRDVRDHERRSRWLGSCCLAAVLCLPLDLAEESAVDTDVFYGSCRRPDASLILMGGAPSRCRATNPHDP